MPDQPKYIYHLLITDIRLPDRSGIELLKEAMQPGIAAVVITAYGSVEDAVEAMRTGAHRPTEVGQDPELAAADGAGLNNLVEGYRQRLIVAALERCSWRKKDAARELRLSPRALSHYISKYDLDRLNTRKGSP